MGRAVRFSLWFIGALVALFAVSALALYLFFDANDFRDEISETVKSQTGRDLTIDGDISLQLFPWLAVEVGKASLGDAPGFGDEPMASFDSAAFSVRLLPILFRQEVVVGAADIESLRLNLSVNKSGVSNWDDLLSAKDDDEAAADKKSGGGIDINSVEILDATIRYTNQQSGDTWLLEQLNVDIGRLKDDGSPVPVSASTKFDLQPAAVAGVVDFETTLAYEIDSATWTLGKSSIAGTLEGVSTIPTRLNLKTDGIVVKTNESRIELQTVDLSVFDMHIVADIEPFSYENEITPKAKLAVDAFSPRSVMQLFGVTPPETADPVALSRLIIDASAAVGGDAVKLTDLAIKLDDTSFTGSLSIPTRSSGTYQFDLVGDSIDLNRYMEPARESAGGSGGEETAIEIPVDLIRPLKARGQIKLKKATLGNIIFENIELGLNSNDGKMRIFPVSSQLFGGKYNGDVRIDVAGATPALAMNESISGVDMAQLVKAMFDQDNVTGTVAGTFKLNGKGADMDAVRRSLAGNLSLELKDGAFEGTDMWYELRRARALLKKETPPQPVLPPKTKFSSVNMTGVVSNGVMQSDDLFAELPFMQLTGQGKVDLVASTINYGLTARILERPEFLKGATPEELEEFTEAVIPLKVTGALTSPRVQPDLEKLLRKRVEDEIKDKLKDKLKGLFDRQ